MGRNISVLFNFDILKPFFWRKNAALSNAPIGISSLRYLLTRHLDHQEPMIEIGASSTSKSGGLTIKQHLRNKHLINSHLVC